MKAIDAILAIEQDANRASVAVFHLQDYLSACAARGDGRLQEAMLIACSDGKSGDGLLGIVALSGEDGAALCAKTR